jgi:hypothetical protein
MEPWAAAAIPRESESFNSRQTPVHLELSFGELSETVAGRQALNVVVLECKREIPTGGALGTPVPLTDCCDKVAVAPVTPPQAS